MTDPSSALKTTSRPRGPSSIRDSDRPDVTSPATCALYKVPPSAATGE